VLADDDANSRQAEAQLTWCNVLRASTRFETEHSGKLQTAIVTAHNNRDTHCLSSDYSA
jgi:hypothetical protein